MSTIADHATTADPDSTGVRLRPARPDDAPAVAQIIYDAFAGIHDHHRFPRDFPTLEVSSGLASAFILHPSIWAVVAERDGEVIGSNFVDERADVRGVGPITVAPGVQERGIGRRLMEAVIERSSDAAGIRLLQDAFNTRSLALYASLGFEVTDPVALVSGRPDTAPPPGYDVRPLTHDDLAAAAAISLAVHGYERTAELRDALATRGRESFVALRDGRIAGYATTLTSFSAAHAVADSQEAMTALIAGAAGAAGAPLAFLLPTRQHELFRWALGAGLRVVKPMNYMVMGHHREPRGAWVPSVLH